MIKCIIFHFLFVCFRRNILAKGRTPVVFTKDSYGLAYINESFYHNKVAIIRHSHEFILYFKCLLCVFPDKILFCDYFASCYTVEMCGACKISILSEGWCFPMVLCFWLIVLILHEFVVAVLISEVSCKWDGLLFKLNKAK